MASVPILLLMALVLIVATITVIRSDTPIAELPAQAKPDVAAGDGASDDVDAPAPASAPVTVPVRWTEEQIELMRRAAGPDLREQRREPARR